MSLFSRLWTYQSERFPLAKVVPLLVVFSAASVTLSAVLGQRALPGISTYLTAFLLVLILFFQMRVCDEVKDLDDDQRYRPERPIPRGLVSLRLIVGIGLATVPVAVIVAVLQGGGLIWLLVLVWIWLTAMTLEFGVPEWLKARPVVYLLSHMLIMPLIDLMLTGAEWLPHSGPASGLWLFIVLSFVNGCVLELGRKILAPESERVGVDTYSGLWGPRRVVLIWLGGVLCAFVLLFAVGVVTNTALIMAMLGAVGLVCCLLAGLQYLRTQTPKSAKMVDTIAGLWVFLCYASAGFVPLLAGGTS